MNPSPPRRGLPRYRLALAGALAVGLAAALAILWLLLRPDAGPAPAPPPTVSTSTDSLAGSGLAARDLDGDGVVYQSGMHPWIVEDAPGTCPICGMDLVPVRVDAGEAGTVAIDPVTLQNMGVRTARAEVRPLERTLRTTGTFTPVDAAREAVSLKIGGWVEALHVDTEGQQVRRGQPLLALYSPDLVATQQEYLLALRNRALLGGGPDADRVVEAARTRLRLYDISDEQVARLEATGEVQRTLTLYAPASGTVVDKAVVEGQQVTPGATLMHIVDLSTLWLQVDVPEQELGWVTRGTRAEVTVPALPGEILSGPVEYVYDTLDPALRTGRARVTVRNPGGRLKPGMYATVTLAGGASTPAPVVPSEAVVRTGGEAIVLLALGEGRFRPRVVVLGEESGGEVQVVEGLRGGEEVVTSAQFLIDSEARLASAMRALEAPPAGAPATPGAPDHRQMQH